MFAGETAFAGGPFRVTPPFAGEPAAALCAPDPVFFACTGLPTDKYFLIFSSRFAPIPRIASKSSTLLNVPYDLRICRIFPAVEGPMPGTCCNSAELAVFKLTG